MSRRQAPQKYSAPRRLWFTRLEDRTLPATLMGLNSTGNSLLLFNSATPGTFTSLITVTGLNAGESLQGIDFRPATGQLFGVGIAGTTARIGAINLTTGTFLPVGSPFTISGSDFGFDFNPTNDRIRLTSDTDINLAINPIDGVVTTQTPLNPGNPNVVGSAYTNNVGTATATTLYDIDSGTDQLLIQNPPASGTLTSVGPLGVNTNGSVGFDIAGNGVAFASLTAGGASALYTINLMTGAATQVGQISPTPITVRDLTVVRFSWDGGGLSPNWTDANNWLGDIAPVAGDDLVFPGSTLQAATSNNDFPAGTNFNSITFTGTGYTISGNALSVAAGILDNTVGGSNHFNVGLNLGTSQSITVTNATSTLSLGGAITGPSGSNLTKRGPGTLQFTTTTGNTYTGTTIIADGTLLLSTVTADAGISSTIIVGDDQGGPNTAVLRLVNSSEVPNNANITVLSDGRVDVSGTGNTEDVQFLTLGSAVGGGNVTMGAGDTLQINDGGTIDSVASGTASTISGGVLRLESNTVTITVANGAAASDLIISSAIGESVAGAGLIKAGSGTLQLSGTTANTYTGTTTVTDGVLLLSKTAGVNAVAGDMVIGVGASSVQTANVLLGASNQIADTAVLNFLSDGGFSTGGNNEVVGSLSMVGGRINSGAGIFGLATPATIVAQSDSSGNPATIAGTLDLGAFTSSIDVGGSTVTIGLDISATIVNGAVIKLGSGVLRYSGTAANTYTGSTTVGDGILELNKPAGVNAIFGPVVVGDGTGAAESAILRLLAGEQINGASPVSVQSDGTFDLNNLLETIGLLTIDGGSVTIGTGLLDTVGIEMTGGSITSSGAGMLVIGNSDVVVHADPSGSTITGTVNLGNATRVFTIEGGPTPVGLDIDGAIVALNSTVGLTKAGTGVLQFSGTTTNTYAGTTTVNAGVLNLNKSGGAIAVSGPLTVDGGTVVEILGDQVIDSATITVSSNGTFDLNGNSDTIGTLTAVNGIVLTDGGRLTTGDTSFDTNSILGMTLASGGNSDLVTVNGTVALGGTLQLSSATILPVGTIITLIDNDGTDPIAGSFINAPEGSSVNAGGTTFQITYMGGSNNNDVVLTAIGNSPTVTINQATGQLDPTHVSPIVFSVVFSAPVTGFTGSDISFTGSTVGGTLVASVSGSGADYTVTVTGMSGEGTVVASIPAGVAQGAGGDFNLASTSFDNTVTFDAIAPTVTIDQGIDQDDPTNHAPIVFDVVFSEPVTGFTGAGVSFAGSTAGGVLVASVSGSGTTYTVSVTGMQSNGFVVASILPGAAFDAAGNGNTPSTSTDNTVRFQGRIELFAAGVGSGTTPVVKVYNADGTLHANFLAYALNFLGGVTVATGDVTGDGVDDIITGAGPGGGPHVKVFDGKTGVVVASFFAYDQSFRGGVFVAAGDVNGDHRADVITGAGPGGGPHVRVFNAVNFAGIYSFFAFPGFTGGVSVAAGDINGDGRADIITGAGPGGGPHVKVFSGADLSLLRSFFPYATSFTGGVFVASGDVNADGRADIITGAGAGGGSHVEVFSGLNQALLFSFFAYPGFTGGVRVAAGDLNEDGHAEIITGAGPNGQPLVKVFSGANLSVLEEFLAFDPTFTGGVFVG